MKKIDHLLENDTETLAFLRTRYPLYHLSNVFFRDIQYGIQVLLERRGVKVGYMDSERLAQAFVSRLENKKVLVPIDRQSWVLYYEDFKTMPVKRASQAATAKAAPAAKPAERTSGGLPPLKSSSPTGSPKPSSGLPPLKSSAPSGAKQAAPPAETIQDAAAAPTPEAPKEENKAAVPVPRQETLAAAKPSAPGVKKSLPQIKSSVPAGSKK